MYLDCTALKKDVIFAAPSIAELCRYPALLHLYDNSYRYQSSPSRLRKHGGLAHVTVPSRTSMSLIKLPAAISSTRMLAGASRALLRPAARAWVAPGRAGGALLPAACLHRPALAHAWARHAAGSRTSWRHAVSQLEQMQAVAPAAVEAAAAETPTEGAVRYNTVVRFSAVRCTARHRAVCDAMPGGDKADATRSCL